nr:hypothetical protein [Tanacetum cinerariifolium]
MYNGKYDDNKEEDDDFVVCDLVQSKGVDVLGKDYGTGFIKGLEDDNRIGNVSVQAFYIDNHPQIVQMCDFKLEQERSESLFPTFGSNGLADNGGICKPELETLSQILQWMIPNPNRMMTNSGGTDSYDQTFTYAMEIEITMSGLNGNSLIVDLEAAKMNKHGIVSLEHGTNRLSYVRGFWLKGSTKRSIEVPAIVFVHELVPELLDVDEDTGLAFVDTWDWKGLIVHYVNLGGGSFIGLFSSLCKFREWLVQGVVHLEGYMTYRSLAYYGSMRSMSRKPEEVIKLGEKGVRESPIWKRNGHSFPLMLEDKHHFKRDGVIRVKVGVNTSQPNNQLYTLFLYKYRYHFS